MQGYEDLRILTEGLLEGGEFSTIELSEALKAIVEEAHKILDKTGISGLEGSELARLKKFVFNLDIPDEKWKPYVFFREEKYARNLVDQGNGNFDLLLLTWMPGQQR